MIITTSRKPSQRTRSFVRDLERTLNLPYIQRGKLSLKELFEMDKHILLIGEFKANPGTLVVYDVENNRRLSSFISVKLQREICGEKIYNNDGIKIRVSRELQNNEDFKKYYEIYNEFLFQHLNIDEDSNITLKLEKDPKYLFALQFYKDRVKIGPLIRVKSIKLFDRLYDK
ncbi:putative Brix domain-containing ribosomal biogenesis protein [Methanocaldococcus lauensis]|uniref:Probable Brix domain-containing ribosomal biogenesis protein n=1 Tax=Methanocaldococcus lauensis TaxID=2546128 RepID=A0A8D6SX84_9EURY|nr:rRNA maturation protein [Methanocaldococcus lauensis]CAB3289709.1 putative Brix domain-containing ribosomal biogenesis protein [Methanocaldococcus lauensis]